MNRLQDVVDRVVKDFGNLIPVDTIEYEPGPHAFLVYFKRTPQFKNDDDIEVNVLEPVSMRIREDFMDVDFMIVFSNLRYQVGVKGRITLYPPSGNPLEDE